MKTFVDSFSQNCDPMLYFDCAGLCRGILWNLFFRFLGLDLIFTLEGLFLGPPGSAVRGGAPHAAVGKFTRDRSWGTSLHVVLLEDHKCWISKEKLYFFTAFLKKHAEIYVLRTKLRREVWDPSTFSLCATCSVLCSWGTSFRTHPRPLYADFSKPQSIVFTRFSLTVFVSKNYDLSRHEDIRWQFFTKLWSYARFWLRGSM